MLIKNPANAFLVKLFFCYFDIFRCHQYVDCPTRGERALDLFHANVREAYRAVSLPPLGRSDHSTVYLQPTYRPCVQRLPVTSRSFRKWSPEARDALRDCFDVTDWAVLLEEEEMDIGMDRRVSIITDHINFCRDTDSSEDCKLLS